MCTCIWIYVGILVMIWVLNESINPVISKPHQFAWNTQNLVFRKLWEEIGLSSLKHDIRLRFTKFPCHLVKHFTNAEQTQFRNLRLALIAWLVNETTQSDLSLVDQSFEGFPSTQIPPIFNYRFDCVLEFVRKWR